MDNQISFSLVKIGFSSFKDELYSLSKLTLEYPLKSSMLLKLENRGIVVTDSILEELVDISVLHNNIHSIT